MTSKKEPRNPVSSSLKALGQEPVTYHELQLALKEERDRFRSVDLRAIQQSISLLTQALIDKGMLTPQDILNASKRPSGFAGKKARDRTGDSG